MSLLPTTLQFLLLISSSTAQAQPLSAAPFLRWAVAAQDRVTAAPVVGSDPSIYVGSWDCSLYCIQTSPPQQGQVLWRFTIPGYGGIGQPPCAIQSAAVIDVASATLYFTGVMYGGLYALNVSAHVPPGSSRLLWMYNASQQQLSGSPVLGSDSTVYYSSFDGSVYAVHSATAAQRWNFTTRGTPQTPALSSGSVPRLFVASMDATLYALSATGTLIWSFPAPSQQGFSAPPVVGIGDAVALVLAGNMDGRLYAVEQSSGALVWVFSTFPAADTSQLSPVTNAPLATPSTIFFCGSDNFLYAVSASAGQLLWRASTGNRDGATPVLSPDGSTLYVGSLDGYIYAFFAAGSSAGQLRWKFLIGGGLTSTGALSPAGSVLYSANASVPGVVFALQLPESTPAPSPSPATAPPSDGLAARLLRMPVALALLIFAVAWLANLVGVLCYCRLKRIPPWPQPVIAATLLFVFCWLLLRRKRDGSIDAPLLAGSAG